MVTFQGSLLTTGLLATAAPVVNLRVPVRRTALSGGAWVDFAPGWLLGADELFEHLLAAVPWRQGRRWMYERVVDDPRLSCWYAAEDELPHPALADVRTALGRHYGVGFGSVGLNYYRNGRDSVAPHRDRELRHLDETLVAIVTLGGQRPFHLRRLGGGDSYHLRPASGDLLVMGGTFQRTWEHAVPKTVVSDPRISLSMRWSAGKGRPEHAPEWKPYGLDPE